MSRRRPSGFTLIELMISVTIVGILSSVALPNFRNLQLRSRQAERRTMVRMLETATEDLWVRDGRWPQGTPAASTFDGPWNPPLPPSTSKREWDRSPTNGDWAALTLGVEGSLYVEADAEDDVLQALWEETQLRCPLTQSLVRQVPVNISLKRA